jgi:UDP-N-acetyl-D-galactosamine dehydrogenase
VDIIRELSEYGLTCLVHDPLASPEETLHEYGLALCPESAIGGCDAVILAVPHKAFLEKGAAWIRSLLRHPSRSAVMDVKSALRKEDLPEVAYWRL